MDIDTMISNALGETTDKDLDKLINKNTTNFKDKETKLEDVQTNNVICKTLDALGFLEMEETKKAARTIHNKVLMNDIENSRVNVTDKLSKVFKVFMKSRYGSKFCIGNFSYYYIYYHGTKVSLKDLLNLEGLDKSSNLGKIINVLDNINMGICNVDTLGVRLCDSYGNNLAIKNLIS